MSIEKRTYTWDGPGEPVYEDVARIDPADHSMEEVLAFAPVGSTIVWKDVAAPAGHPFAEVPSVKLGEDEFAAHGLAEDRNTFSRTELVAAIRRKTGGSDEAGPVFVTQIELVDHF